MNTSQEMAVRWAARQRCTAEGQAPTVELVAVPDVRARLPLIETLVDNDQLDQAASAGLALLRELDAAALLTWIERSHGHRHPSDEQAVEDAIHQVEEAIQQALFDGCVDAAEQEVAGWDRHLVQRNRRLWTLSRFWLTLARRRACLEPATPDLALPALRRSHIPWPVTSDMRAAAAADEAGPSSLPTLITCQPDDGSWKAVLRLPPEPGGPIRVRVATPADQPVTGTIRCCGEICTLDAAGCVHVPWALVASAWNEGGVWVDREVGGSWVAATVVDLT